MTFNSAIVTFFVLVANMSTVLAKEPKFTYAELNAIYTRGLEKIADKKKYIEKRDHSLLNPLIRSLNDAIVYSVDERSIINNASVVAINAIALGYLFGSEISKISNDIQIVLKEFDIPYDNIIFSPRPNSYSYLSGVIEKTADALATSLTKRSIRNRCVVELFNLKIINSSINSDTVHQLVVDAESHIVGNCLASIDGDNELSYKLLIVALARLDDASRFYQSYKKRRA